MSVIRTLRAQGQIERGELAWREGRFADARQDLEEGLRYLEGIVADLSGNDQKQTIRSVTTALLNLGNVARDSENYEEARAFYERALVRCEELQDEAGAMSCLNNLGLIEEKSPATWDAAADHFQQALNYWLKLGDFRRIANARQNLAMIASNKEEFKRARDLNREAREVYAELGDTVGIGRTLHNEALIEARTGNRKRALELLRAGLEQFWSAKALKETHAAFVEIAAVMVSEDVEAAVKLFGVAQQLREELPVEDSTLDPNGSDADVERARSLVSASAFSQYWQFGKMLPMEEAIELARGAT